MIENPCSRPFVEFHRYKVYRDSTVIGKKGQPLKVDLRERRGGKFDKTVRLYYKGKTKKWTLSRLVAACFLGPIDGYEINHIDRNTLNCHVDNLERTTPKENQKHWRDDERTKEGNDSSTEGSRDPSTEEIGSNLHINRKEDGYNENQSLQDQ